jgi:hypothetical protein
MIFGGAALASGVAGVLVERSGPTAALVVTAGAGAARARRVRLRRGGAAGSPSRPRVRSCAAPRPSWVLALLLGPAGARPGSRRRPVETPRRAAAAAGAGGAGATDHGRDPRRSTQPARPAECAASARTPSGGEGRARADAARDRLSRVSRRPTARPCRAFVRCCPAGRLPRGTTAQGRPGAGERSTPTSCARRRRSGSARGRRPDPRRGARARRRPRQADGRRPRRSPTCARQAAGAPGAALRAGLGPARCRPRGRPLARAAADADLRRERLPAGVGALPDWQERLATACGPTPPPTSLG